MKISVYLENQNSDALKAKKKIFSVAEGPSLAMMASLCLNSMRIVGVES